MKLKLSYLKGTQSGMLANVKYDADDEGNCKKAWVRHVALNEVVDLPDDVAHALMAKYPKNFKLAPEAPVGPEKKTKDAEAAHTK